MTPTTSVNTRALPATQDVTQRVKGQGTGINKYWLVSKACNPWLDTVSQRSVLVTSVYGHESQCSGISYARKSALRRAWNPLQLWEKRRADQSSKCVCVRAKVCRVFRIISAAISDCEGMRDLCPNVVTICWETFFCPELSLSDSVSLQAMYYPKQAWPITCFKL